MSYRIIGDSCVDTNEKMEKELELIKVPFSVNIGEKVIVDEDIDLPMFLKEMNNSPEPTKTAAPSPGGFLSALEGAKEMPCFFIVKNANRKMIKFRKKICCIKGTCPPDNFTVAAIKAKFPDAASIHKIDFFRFIFIPLPQFHHT